MLLSPSPGINQGESHNFADGSAQTVP